MKTAILTASILLFGSVVVGTAAADRTVCQNVTLAACAGHGVDWTKGAYCPYAWVGVTGPTFGAFVCGGDNNCNIYYDTFALGPKGCFNGSPYNTIGDNLFIVGSFVYTVLP